MCSSFTVYFNQNFADKNINYYQKINGFIVLTKNINEIFIIENVEVYSVQSIINLKNIL